MMDSLTAFISFRLHFILIGNGIICCIAVPIA